MQWLSKDRYAGTTRDTAKREASPLLQRLHGKLDGIFAPNESSANGMLDALRSLSMSQQVRLVGFDSSEPLLNAVEAGDIEGLRRNLVRSFPAARAHAIPGCPN